MRIIINIWLHYTGTLKHKLWVLYYLLIFCARLMWRGIVHDLSKFTPIEARGFIQVIHKLKTSSYGTEDYKANLNHIRPSVIHHQESNRHHPEHYLYLKNDPLFTSCGIESEIDFMDLVDIVEMLSDWRAANKRHKDGNIIKSININEGRFNMTRQLSRILINTVE